MKARLKTIDDHGVIYQALLFVCPGCVAGGSEGYEGIHMLPVNVEVALNKPSWEWDGNLEAPTLSPSILTSGSNVRPRCHSFLRAGVFEFLQDCEHSLVGQKVMIPDLPKWAEDLS